MAYLRDMGAGGTLDRCHHLSDCTIEADRLVEQSGERGWE